MTPDGNLLELDFPAHPPSPATMPDELPAILGARPVVMVQVPIQRWQRFTRREAVKLDG